MEKWIKVCLENGSKMKILYRVSNDISTGLGHIVRSLQIGSHLSRKGHEISFIVDEPLGKLIKDIESSNKFEIFYEKNIHLSDKQKQIIIDKKKEKIFDLLIIDSYDTELINKYSKHFGPDKTNIVIDDPQSNSTLGKPIQIGIKFGAENNQVVFPVREIHKSTKKENKQKILIYFGSAYIGTKLLSFLQIIGDIAKKEELANFQIVIFAYKNSELFHRIYNFLEEQSLKKEIEIINDIDLYWGEYCLIVGSASTIIYEAASMRIPMITISMNRNQSNLDWQLERIGHFMNFMHLDEVLSEKFGILIILVLQNLQKIRTETFSNCVGLNSQSLEVISKNILSTSFFNQASGPDMKLDKDLLYVVKTMDWKNINKLLEARNSIVLKKYLINSENIQKIDHYIWWFKNQRNNFIFEWGKYESIYIWHQITEISERRYLIGGWLPLKENVKFDRIALALAWQLKYTEKLYGLPWLAVINKSNKSTLFLNLRAGFKEVLSSSVEHKDACKIFQLDGKTEMFKVLKKI